MQRTLTTLGLILSLLVCGCDEATTGSDEAFDRYCSLPDTALCASFLGTDGAGPDVGGADAGLPTFYDAGTLAPDAGASGDASVDDGDASVGATDAGAADAGSEGAVTENPCDVEDCDGPAPSTVLCGDGTMSNVSCQPSFFGACEWHFVCGTP